MGSYAEGTFKLALSNLQADNSPSVTTYIISMQANANTVKLALEDTKIIGGVNVRRDTLPQCVNGCGQNYERGDGHTWTITFLNIQVAIPIVEVVDVEFIGGVIQTSTGNVSNVQAFSVAHHVDIMREGQFIQVSEVPIYGRSATEHAPVEAVLGENEWLTPFWLMLFSDTDAQPPVGLEEGLTEAIWKKRYTNIQDVLQVILTLPLTVSYIKIQREGYGSLSIAEIEVYQEKINTMESYEYGTEIASSSITNPYQSAMPFNVMFNNLLFDGRWILQIKQEVGNPVSNTTSTAGINTKKTDEGFSGSYGTISDVVLIITDMAGLVHTYYQDLRAEVKNLPKYGTLFQAPTHTPSPYDDWRQAFELGPGGELLPKTGGNRPLGVCYAVDTTESRSGVDGYRYCSENYGVGPLLDTKNKFGDVAAEFFLRGERTLFYQPNLLYLGPDYFVYVIHDGLNIQSHIGSSGKTVSKNEVTVHVRNCRQYARQLQFGLTHDLHALCTCAQDEYGLVGNTAECTVIRKSVCVPSVLGTDVYKNSTRLDFLNMCLSCEVQGFDSTDCISETQRAVSLVTQRGMCVSDPYMDCTAETVTTGGREAVNYLSLATPVTTIRAESFTQGTNAIGSMGWYSSSPHA